jgi:hypothetical protein
VEGDVRGSALAVGVTAVLVNRNLDDQLLETNWCEAIRSPGEFVRPTMVSMSVDVLVWARRRVVQVLRGSLAFIGGHGESAKRHRVAYFS